MVKHLNSFPAIQPSKQNTPKEVPVTNPKQDFTSVLDKAIEKSSSQKRSEGLTFSKHALSRLQERQIVLDANSVGKLDGAIDRAAKKGSKESLIISDNAAFIVNVPKRRVITALDKAQMHDNIFTNIDSTVIA